MMSNLSIKDAAGRQISLLNNSNNNNNTQQTTTVTVIAGKRKYHCIEPGCNKSFTTSGHLARHHRIHTGEKNFQCRHPGCPSRFSRQDNMMQHYRTHLSPKSRRQQQQQRKKVTKQSPSPSSPSSTQPKLQCQTKLLNNNNSIEPLDNNRNHNNMTRPRRAVTLPSSFESYIFGNKHESSSSSSSSYTTSPISMNDTLHHHYLPPLVQPLSLSMKPTPMEPVSSTSMISPTLQHDSLFHSHPQRRPQRAHSTSSTSSISSLSSSSSSSFLSPPLPSSPSLPLQRQQIISEFTKPMIHLPPPQLRYLDTHGNHKHFDLDNFVSTFC